MARSAVLPEPEAAPGVAIVKLDLDAHLAFPHGKRAAQRILRWRAQANPASQKRSSAQPQRSSYSTYRFSTCKGSPYTWYAETNMGKKKEARLELLQGTLDMM